jgi:iron complex transport system substrate-binding protein
MSITTDAPAEISDDATRRSFVAGALGLGLALLGCGDEEADRDAAPAGAPGGYPVTVEHRYGSTRIPAEPRRVVTVGLTDADAVYALGVVPVAGQAWYAERVIYPWAAEVAPNAKTAILPMGDGVNVEAVAAQRPDLIVGVTSEVTEGQYSQLSEFAPTIVAPRGRDAATTTWQEQTLMIGRALAREERARELVAGVQDAFRAAAARHPEWKGASAVLASQYIQGKLLVYRADSPTSSFLTDLGFEISPELAKYTDDAFGVPALSVERFDLIDVDLVLWDGVRESLKGAGLFDVPTYKALDIVDEGRQVFPSERVADALSFKNVLSLPWALERLEPLIAAAFDGDPTTTG